MQAIIHVSLIGSHRSCGYYDGPSFSNHRMIRREARDSASRSKGKKKLSLGTAQQLVGGVPPAAWDRRCIRCIGVPPI